MGTEGDWEAAEDPVEGQGLSADHGLVLLCCYSYKAALQIGQKISPAAVAQLVHPYFLTEVEQKQEQLGILVVATECFLLLKARSLAPSSGQLVQDVSPLYPKRTVPSMYLSLFLSVSERDHFQSCRQSLKSEQNRDYKNA